MVSQPWASGFLVEAPETPATCVDRIFLSHGGWHGALHTQVVRFSTMSERDSLKRAFALASRFRASNRERAPAPTATVAEIERAFDGPTPETGLPGPQVIDALAAAAEPGLMGNYGPRFFGWVMGGSHPVGIAADWLAAAWGQNSAIYATAPAAAAAEQAAGRWLLDILDLPREASVGFVTGATMANFTCLAAARSALLARAGWDVELDGLHGAPPLQVFIGEEAHATVFVALQYLGLGRSRATVIDTDGQGRMNAAALGQALQRQKGPALVIAQAGQINTGACDPFPMIADSCKEFGAWLHVDGAFGLWARAWPEGASLAAGAEHADSWATDGHKWLQVPYDCGYAIVRDKAAHARAMAITASYLPSADEDRYEPSRYVPELSRRARGFSTWAVIRTLGRRGIREMIARHCSLARRIAEQLDRQNGIEILNEVVLNQVIVGFGLNAPKEMQDAYAKSVVARVQAKNVCFVGGGAWKGRWVMRISVISWQTKEADADILAEQIVRAWRYVRNDAKSEGASDATTMRGTHD